MDKKKILKYGVVLFVVIIMILINVNCRLYDGKKLVFAVDIKSDVTVDDVYSIYYTTDKNSEFDESHRVNANVPAKCNEEIALSFPNDVKTIRLDLGSREGTIEIKKISLSYKGIPILDSDKKANQIIKLNDVKVEDKDNVFDDQLHAKFVVDGLDPYIVWDTTDWDIQSIIDPYIEKIDRICKALVDLVVLFGLIVYIKKFDFFVEFPREIYQSKKLIFQLSKNDFKTKFAGSYLGIFWAFVQPIVTVVLYWFVFEKGLRAGSMVNVPFVLWLIAGLVPWFFFQDSLIGGTNALIEYQYLVKKVVFQIDILPIVKVFSAMYVHLFFIAFMLILYSCYGYFPNPYTLQILYYVFCTFVLVLGISYATSAIVGFFRDLIQIINIALQVGTWMTPIMWNFESLGLPGWLKLIFQMNPMFYIVQGYRDALINHIWFWERPAITIYFWLTTILIMGVGTTLFKKLKVHFADVL